MAYIKSYGYMGDPVAYIGKLQTHAVGRGLKIFEIFWWTQLRQNKCNKIASKKL